MLTKEQAVVLMVYTGVVLIDPQIFRHEIEKKLEREVHAHEFSSPNIILTLKDVYANDFADLVYREDKPIE